MGRQVSCPTVEMAKINALRCYSLDFLCLTDQTRSRLRYLEMCSIAALTEKHEVRTQVNENYRNSKTGKFVTKEYVEEHPKKTETEHNPRRTPPSKTTKKR